MPNERQSIYSYQLKNGTACHAVSFASFPSHQPTEMRIALLAEPVVYSGYVHGFRQPSAHCKLRIGTLSELEIQHLQQALTYYFVTFRGNDSIITSIDELVTVFADVICTMQRAGGLPIFEKPQIITKTANEYEIRIPILFDNCFHWIMAFLLKLVNLHVKSTAFIAESSLVAQLENLIHTLKMHAPQGTNSLRFLQAAFDENIPWRHIAHNAFQYGHGKHSRWLDSSFTDKTPQISTSLARNKRSLSILLHNMGFPVAEQYVINSDSQAIEMAHKIGFPVVIKPLDQDSGKGVYANLASDQSVKKAYQQAKQVSSTVLLEKHIPGKDYRLVVVNGKLLWAIERIPAGVTGDSVHTIQALAEQHNQHHAAMFPLRHIQITADTTEYLSEQSLYLSSIVKSGQFVPLNRIANISMGGTPIGVFEKVHPDNIKLVETIAKILRIDIAGIDFISPNIEQSYLENGGKIIEVNTQPQLGSTTAPHIYKQILSTLLKENGRIPIIVIVGDALENINQLQKQLLPQYEKVGIAEHNAAYINGEKVTTTSSLFQAGVSLLAMDEIDAVIYHITESHDIERHGLPFDRYDRLLLLDPTFANREHLSQSNQTILDTLLKACRGQVSMESQIYI